MADYTVKLNNGKLVHINTNTLEIREIKEEAPVSETERDAWIVECIREIKKQGLPV